MRLVLTNVEKLDRKHPGLRQHVDFRLDAGVEIATICGELQEMFEEFVPEKTLSNYKQRRWLPAKDRVRLLAEDSEAILQVVGKYGSTAVTEAYIFERLAKAKEEGVEVAPSALLREQRMRERIRLEERKLEVYRQDVENRERLVAIREKEEERRAAEMREKVGQVAGIVAETKESIALGKPFDPVAVYRRISDVIGVGLQLEERHEAETNQDGPGPATGGEPIADGPGQGHTPEDLMRDTTDAIGEAGK